MVNKEKPQRIPSWDDSLRPKKPTPLNPAPKQTIGYRADNFNARHHPNDFQQQQGHTMTNNRGYQQRVFSFGQSPMQVMESNMQTIAYMLASANAATGVVAPHIGRWEHVNPNFDFGGRQKGNDEDFEKVELLEGEVKDGNMMVSEVEEEAAIALPPQPPQLHGCRLTPDEDLRAWMSVKRPRTRQQNGATFAVACCPATSQQAPNFDEADQFLDTILSDTFGKNKTKVRELFPFPAPQENSIIQGQSLPLQNQKSTTTYSNQSPIPPGPRLNEPSQRRPPAAQNLMRLDDGLDVSRNKTVLLRSYTSSPYSGRKESKHKGYHLEDREVISSSRHTARERSAQNHQEHRYSLLSRLPVRPTDAQHRHFAKKEARRMSESRNQDDGRRISREPPVNDFRRAGRENPRITIKELPRGVQVGLDGSDRKGKESRRSARNPKSHARELTWLDDNSIAQEWYEIAERQDKEWRQRKASKPLGESPILQSGMHVDLQNKPGSGKIKMYCEEKEKKKRQSKYLDQDFHIAKTAAERAGQQSPPDHILKQNSALGVQQSRATLFLKANITKAEKQSVKEAVAEWHRAKILEIHQKLVHDGYLHPKPSAGSLTRKRNDGNGNEDRVREKRVRLDEPAASGLAGYGFSEADPVERRFGGGVVARESDVMLEDGNEELNEVEIKNTDDVSHVTHSAGILQTPRDMHPTQEHTAVQNEIRDFRLTLVDQATEKSRMSPPVPEGEWILDGLLDSLAAPAVHYEGPALAAAASSQNI
ncbi:uncharacterized protein RCO7_09884 [Rhynchosporium graminicola]|uniref:Uncharacterized protein n=1 Tax=Rhynchosporium graminicola TaxID=2792576 RepID=A0A1E1LF88_9HELO|nr:uncharacterized protein RCO7_09884 [Rhynchosporium commune]